MRIVTIGSSNIAQFAFLGATFNTEKHLLRDYLMNASF